MYVLCFMNMTYFGQRRIIGQESQVKDTPKWSNWKYLIFFLFFLFLKNWHQGTYLYIEAFSRWTNTNWIHTRTSSKDDFVVFFVCVFYVVRYKYVSVKFNQFVLGSWRFKLYFISSYILKNYNRPFFFSKSFPKWDYQIWINFQGNRVRFCHIDAMWIIVFSSEVLSKIEH